MEEEKLGRTPILAWGEKATLEGWPAGSLNRNPVTPDLQDPADLQNRLRDYDWSRRRVLYGTYQCPWKYIVAVSSSPPPGSYIRRSS